MLEQVRPAYQARDDQQARRWLEHFDGLGDKLRIRVPEPTREESLPSAA
jgi:hypothetical protein